MKKRGSTGTVAQYLDALSLALDIEVSAQYHAGTVFQQALQADADQANTRVLFG